MGGSTTGRVAQTNLKTKEDKKPQRHKEHKEFYCFKFFVLFVSLWFFILSVLYTFIMFESALLEKRLRNISRRLTQFYLQRPDLDSRESTTFDIEQYRSGKAR